MGVRHEKSSVDLHIEELVLDGFSPGDRLLISDAIERELSRLIGEESRPGWAVDRIGSRWAERLDGGEFRLEPGWKPRDVGVQIAQAVNRGLMPEAANSARRTGRRPQTGFNR